MKYIYKMESVLISIVIVFCTVLLVKLLYKLRSALPWRVNCWFCNNDFWVKYPVRNSWTCQKCDQYNGFTKDGDYNKPITACSDQGIQTPKVFKRSPPKNGLCKMCNINQQLKVTQLANFVPMNDKKFDDEIESYRLQLEKAYKLCSPCRKVVQMKLHKEKETLLGSKLLETRTSDNKSEKEKQYKQTKLLRKLINNTSMLIAVILFILVSFELYTNLTLRHKNLLSTITNIKVIVLGLLERIYSIIEMKTTLTFPALENYFYDINIVNMMPKSFNFRHINVDQLNISTQETLGSFVCFLQIIGLIWNVNSLKNTILIDMQWLVYVIATLGHRYVAVEPIYLSLIKIMCLFIVILAYKSTKTEAKKIEMKSPTSPKRMKNLVNSSASSLIDDDDDTMHLDSDDDVSLSKFGLHNFSESSNENLGLNASMMNGRTFTPRTDSIWTKPKLNSTFCVNSVISNSPSSVSDTIFVKPSFNKYQKLIKDDSDSELDESISSLCISSPKKSKKTTNSVFSLRKFTATPSFIAPTPMARTRPLISPSKLGHSTSWVAGGYWGSEGERQIFSVDGSRSSSQSSGFESQTSSVNQRNMFSQPPSREESICGEPMVLDRFPTMSSLNGFQSPQHFNRISSPVFPQMQYNSHVHIPQAQFAQQNSMSGNMFVHHQQHTQSSLFKTPGGSGLIKLPQVNSFSTR
ncbi:unnamed protein product [Spodoptera littoralis]|uniref:Ima1 N-terminal domain-containing protein n=1 Tax=Spodoptera littoralis TaxID=7109 RepID=A0A9P0N935_SPOLI|nr:unnamed protein product [Spodoptera littoralis]CAH1645865.1 unnamed protein product [Spodoptera littoralis]